MFTPTTILSASVSSSISSCPSNLTDKERILNLADLSLIGQVADKGFFELFPDCACSPERVTEVFVQEGLLPAQILDKDAKSGKLLFSARSLEAAIWGGKVTPGLLQISSASGAEEISSAPENSVPTQREVLCWKELTLDYSISLYWIRSFNAARKAALKLRKEKEKESGIKPDSKESKKEKNYRLRAEAAERNFQSLQEQGIENMKRITLHTGRVIQAIEEVLSFSTFKKGEKEKYEKAVSHLKGLLPNLETLTSPDSPEK